MGLPGQLFSRVFSGTIIYYTSGDDIFCFSVFSAVIRAVKELWIFVRITAYVLSPPQRFPEIFQGGPAGEQARAINILEDW